MSSVLLRLKATSGQALLRLKATSGHARLRLKASGCALKLRPGKTPRQVRLHHSIFLVRPVCVQRTGRYSLAQTGYIGFVN